MEPQIFEPGTSERWETL